MKRPSRRQRAAMLSPRLVRIAVARHGVTRANAERRYVSRSDVPLLPEARAALAPLRRKLAATRPLAFASDMRRCVSTLARVCPHGARHAMLDARLRELDFGRWEGLTYEDLQADPAYRAWLDDMTAVIPPEGESWQRFEARTEAAWQHILREAKRPMRGFGFRAGPLQSRRQCMPAAYCTADKPAHASRSHRHGSCRRSEVLILTHGGVVRRLYTLAFPSVLFWDTQVPTGGGMQIIARLKRNTWTFLRAERLV
ncbi:histidine phosphatase family protein [Paenibacillus aquistagni]|uniref:Alpha-ribazole phosphatase n=1 Tax=Paenibacillus aquistagni TaxID=1852522 RepID=A0A1X7JZY9_9BACL|nr:histidine phosphatase family protein [Paenibacillus aquistagni]SMG33928.1 alpha-ribazole phosphatase [Paenibacillus aquistagni]